jgi:hypothetical protein
MVYIRTVDLFTRFIFLLKINGNKSQSYLSDNRISLTTNWKLYYIAFRVYDFSESIDPLNSHMAINFIHKNNSTDVMYVANPKIEIGRIPSTKSDFNVSPDIYKYIEKMGVGMINGTVRYSFTPKLLDNKSISSSVGNVTYLSNSSLKIEHDTDDVIATVVIDNQWQ